MDVLVTTKKLSVAQSARVPLALGPPKHRPSPSPAMQLRVSLSLGEVASSNLPNGGYKGNIQPIEKPLQQIADQSAMGPFSSRGGFPSKRTNKASR